jgi:hypothetical protein
MKKIILILVVVYLVFLAIQLFNHSNQKVSLNLNLGTILNDYNTIGEKAFKEKIVEIYRDDRLRVKSEDIIITKNKEAGTFRVEVHYHRIFYFLFFPIKRKMIIIKEGSILNI